MEEEKRKRQVHFETEVYCKECGWRGTKIFEAGLYREGLCSCPQCQNGELKIDKRSQVTKK